MVSVRNLNSGISTFTLTSSDSRVSMAAWMMKRNRIGARLSPCLTPTVEGRCILVLPILDVIVILW